MFLVHWVDLLNRILGLEKCLLHPPGRLTQSPGAGLLNPLAGLLNFRWAGFLNPRAGLLNFSGPVY